MLRNLACLSRLPRTSTLPHAPHPHKLPSVLHAQLTHRTQSTSTSDNPSTPHITFPDPRDANQHPFADMSLEDLRKDDAYWNATHNSSPKVVYRRVVDEEGFAHAIGRRKRSRAKVWLREGDGNIMVNGRSWVDYFPRVDHRDKVIRPLYLLGMLGKVDIRCEVIGGGVNGQTEAFRHGVARAIQNYDPHTRPTLKADGLLTRDSRVVESKKYGRKKARKSFQWVKR